MAIELSLGANFMTVAGMESIILKMRPSLNKANIHMITPDSHDFNLKMHTPERTLPF